MSDISIAKESEKGLVKFWAPWCGPCKQLGPIVEQLDELNLGVSIVNVNVDDNPQLAAEYGIMGVPALLFFKNGEKVKQLNGLRTLDELKTVVEGL